MQQLSFSLIQGNIGTIELIVELVIELTIHIDPPNIPGSNRNSH